MFGKVLYVEGPVTRKTNLKLLVMSSSFEKVGLQVQEMMSYIQEERCRRALSEKIAWLASVNVSLVLFANRALIDTEGIKYGGKVTWRKDGAKEPVSITLNVADFDGLRLFIVFLHECGHVADAYNPEVERKTVGSEISAWKHAVLDFMTIVPLIYERKLFQDVINSALSSYSVGIGVINDVLIYGGMLSIDEAVVQSIFAGLEAAADINASFRGFGYADLKPEYLLTYSIADAIHRRFPKYPIELEYSAKEYKDNSIDLTGNLFGALRYNFERDMFTGRIDIVVFEEHKKILCPIEVKLVNPGKKRILSDFMRLMKCLDVLSKYSYVRFGFFTFIIQPNKSLTEDQIDNEVARVGRYTSRVVDKYLEAWKLKFKFDIEYKSVYSCMAFPSTEEVIGRDDEDIANAVKESIQFTGVVVRISRHLEAMEKEP